jgi:hypothetical protein
MALEVNLPAPSFVAFSDDGYNGRHATMRKILLLKTRLRLASTIHSPYALFFRISVGFRGH